MNKAEQIQDLERLLRKFGFLCDEISSFDGKYIDDIDLCLSRDWQSFEQHIGIALKRLHKIYNTNNTKNG